MMNRIDRMVSGLMLFLSLVLAVFNRMNMMHMIDRIVPWLMLSLRLVLAFFLNEQNKTNLIKMSVD